jgi:hypothetical protein
LNVKSDLDRMAIGLMTMFVTTWGVQQVAGEPAWMSQAHP